MNKFHILPDDALQPFIDRLWGWESSPDETIPLPTLLPGTGAELYFHYRTPFRYVTAKNTQIVCETGHLLCLRRQAQPLCPANNLGFIAVRFRAGMLHRFTDIPGKELIDCALSVSDLWGRAGSELAHRTAAADSMDERLRLIQNFLHRRLRSMPTDDLVEHAISSLYRESASLSIEQLATRMKIGPRQLERRCLTLTGQTPNEIRCLSRFQKTVRALLLSPAATPLDVALAEGYYDHAHFIRSFRKFACASPGSFLKTARAKTHFYNTPRNIIGKIATPTKLL